MQIAGTQLSIAHSFSNNFFLSATTQLNSSVFHLSKGPVDVSALTGTYSADLGIGYYFTHNHHGIEMALQLIHEHNQINYRYFSSHASFVPLYVNDRINYLIPSFQLSYNHFSPGQNNYYAACRFSYAYADEFRNGVSVDYEIKEKDFYNQNIFIQPGFYVAFKKLPDIWFEGSFIIGLKKTALRKYYSPTMLSVSISPALLKRL